ncbi:MAG: TIGR02594 family protein [Paracoccaceae bacterium]
MSVLDVQSALQEKGFDPGPIDGAMGPKTRAAIKAFQGANGLVVDGIVGPNTRAKLFGESARKATPDTSIPTDMPWLSEASRLIGVRENTAPGQSNAIIDNWADALDIGFASDEVPWCGLFVGHCMSTGVPDEALPGNPLGARQWINYGRMVKPQLGSILVFWRTSPSSWKGHVGFYWAEDETHYHCLGGNQTNAVNIKRMAKSRLIEARWPNSLPEQGFVRKASGEGILISVSEQ